MKTIAAVLSLVSVMCVVKVTDAAVVHVHEYPDRIVVEIDGSMDPKLISSEGHRQAATQVVKTSEQVVSEKTVSVIPTANKKESEAGLASGKERAVPDAVTTIAVASKEKVLPTVESNQKPEYNRGQQMMDYMAKMPKRSDFVEARLEARQTRWTKRLAASGLNPTEK